MGILHGMRAGDLAGLKRMDFDEKTVVDVHVASLSLCWILVNGQM
jgi:hypothetical protein